MAEALLNCWGKGRFHAVSAGSHPAGHVHPLALAVFERHHLPIAQARSKSWEELSTPDAAPLDPADGDPADEAGEVESGNQHLERALGIALRLGDVIKNGLKQRGQIGARRIQIGSCRPRPARGIEEGRVELVVGGFEIDEQRKVERIEPDHRAFAVVAVVVAAFFGFRALTAAELQFPLPADGARP